MTARHTLIRTLILLGVIGALGACENKDTKIAKAMMSKAAPQAAWDNALIAKADVTCDSKADIFAVADSADGVWVGLVEEFQLGLDAPPTVVRFPYGQEAAAFCAKPKSIKHSERNCDAGAKLPGCQPIKGCQSITLESEGCGPVHFYWDGARSSLTWYR
ncbi:MAG: hypothetical protein K2P94_19230 [Rhodospirillaceae bacterium]|nr:hypothetical protein [Rhodospirillaceae bacterium]